MINFCPGFYNLRILKDAVTYGRKLKSPNNLDLGNYNNKAIFFLVSTFDQLIILLTNSQHELCHLDLAANTPSPNPEINELTIKFRAS